MNSSKPASTSQTSQNSDPSKNGASTDSQSLRSEPRSAAGSSAKWGVLLINLGTPEKPEPAEVGRYLKEFLLDPEVIDIPWLPRQLLVRTVIVPFRKKKSAALYQKIWTDQGSPLAIHTKELAVQVAKSGPELVVTHAYRYGKPSFAQALQELESKKVRNLIVIPLYPQYATSASRTSIRLLDSLKYKDRFEQVKLLSSFHLQPFFLKSQAQLIQKHRALDSHVLFSFHGIPVRHIQKNHTGCEGCLKKPTCHREGDHLCYRRQCTETAEALAKDLGLGSDQWSLSYQSRLGRNEWLLPNTEQVLKDLPAAGKKNLTVVCAGFTADCLETLEEIDGQGREIFEHAGGQKWSRVPCLNTDPFWVEQLSAWIRTQAHATSQLTQLEEA